MIQGVLLDEACQVEQHTRDFTEGECGGVLLHDLGQILHTEGTLVLHTSVILSQRALNGIIGVLRQIDFQHNLSNFKGFIIQFSFGVFRISFGVSRATASETPVSPFALQRYDI